MAITVLRLFLGYNPQFGLNKSNCSKWIYFIGNGKKKKQSLYPIDFQAIPVVAGWKNFED